MKRNIDWPIVLAPVKEHRRRIVLLVLTMVFVGGLDALFPLLSGIAVDRFVVPGTTDGLALFALAYGSAALLLALSVWFLVVTAGRIEMGLMHSFRRAAFRHLQTLSLSYFDVTPVGWIMARLNSDVQRLGETVAWGLVDIVWGSAMMLAVAVAMVVINPPLAALVLLVVPPLALASYWFQRRILVEHRQVRSLNSLISASFNEGISGTATSKVLVREDENLREFGDLTGRMQRASVRAALYSAVYMPVVLLLGSIGTATALLAGGAQVTAGTATMGTVVAFIGYTVLFFEPVREVARVLTEFQSARSAAERIATLLQQQPAITDTATVEAEFGSILEPRQENWPRCSGEVFFQGVSFFYRPEEPVLKNFDLHVAAGEVVALVGETGSGKTTIVNLVSRFYEAQEGRILIDGVDIRERSQSWIRSNLGYVLQTPHLFRGTVRENIRRGRPDATDDEVEAAAAMVAAHDVISALSDGYDHEVGEGGAGLSTGEKQLISFARTILADPRIFILDEATSSIDTETELRIQRATRAILRGRTSFVVAHRFSTIRDANRIVVLHKGQILEAGTHEELLQRDGAYAALYREQFATQPQL